MGLYSGKVPAVNPSVTASPCQLPFTREPAGSARGQFRTKLVCIRYFPDPPGIVTEQNGERKQRHCARTDSGGTPPPPYGKGGVGTFWKLWQVLDLYFDFAPMEGLTDHIYRELHHRYFPGVDRYYTPFFSPTIHRSLTPRERLELPPADAMGYCLVPQILTKVPEDFLWMAEQCREQGYTVVNLNLGCPSGTVTAKGKGAGMLSDPDTLDRFLDAVFSKSPLPISLKTRLGMENPEDFVKILEIFNRYPVAELILHPRVRKDFYKLPVRREWLDYTLENTKIPLCYNGNITSRSEISQFSARYPQVRGIMLGRGLIGDPGMLSPGGTTAASLEAFLEALLEGYLSAFGGSRNAMFRLKEHWSYLLCRFEGWEKLGKRLRKTTSLEEYRAITHEVFTTLPLAPALTPNW